MLVSDKAGLANWPAAAPPGWRPLNHFEFAAAGASSGALGIPLQNALMISVRVAGYAGGGDIASLRFNGDSGANYWSRVMSSAAGATTFGTNAQTTSATLARLFAAAVTTGRSALIHVTNRAGSPKVGVRMGQTSTGAAGTAGIVEIGGFEWINTTAQISTVELLTAGGVNFLAGSTIEIFGIDH